MNVFILKPVLLHSPKYPSSNGFYRDSCSCRELTAKRIWSKPEVMDFGFLSYRSTLLGPIRQRLFTSRAVDGKKSQRYRSAMDNLTQTLPDQEGPRKQKKQIWNGDEEAN